MNRNQKRRLNGYKEDLSEIKHTVKKVVISSSIHTLFIIYTS